MLTDKITAFLLKTADQALELTPEEVIAEAKALLLEAREALLRESQWTEWNASSSLFGRRIAGCCPTNVDNIFKIKLEPLPQAPKEA